MTNPIFVRDESGKMVDITEGVQAMYDLLIGSLDWGSGFLTVEDALPIAELAKACGFEKWEEAEKYVAHEREEEKRRAERKAAGYPSR